MSPTVFFFKEPRGGVKAYFVICKKIKNERIKTEKRIKNSSPFVFFKKNSVNPGPFFCFSFDN
jgi:hypothetical protein